jgi:ABC-2 type transport system ATP-binding protein
MRMVIELDRLTKRYGPLTALDSLSLTIPPGETLGLLGPNGAGKTTTIRLLAGLAQPDGGTVRVGGLDPWTSPEAVRRQMGVLPDGAALYDRLTVIQNLRLFAGLYGVPGARVGEALTAMGIGDLGGRRVGALSKGQRQRVALARAMLHRPAVLVLDEPTAGLDPAATAAFHELIRSLKAQGVTIVLASHDKAEVDALCDRVAILDRGRLMACDVPARLKAAHGRRELAAAVCGSGGVQTLTWELNDPRWVDALAGYQRAGALLSVQTREASLAEVFIYLTGRELR